MKPLILLDLDRTLFKTDDFYKDFKKWILKGHPVSDYYSSIGGNELYRHTDFDRLLEETKLTEKYIIETVKKESSGRNYLFEDFLSNITFYKKNYEFAILTFGQEAFQNIKLSLCPSLKKFEAIISLSPKNHTIQQRFADRIGALVDDKDGQELPKGWIEIHLDRQLSLRKPISAKGCIKISSLNQLTSLLENKLLYESITV